MNEWSVDQCKSTMVWNSIEHMNEEMWNGKRLRMVKGSMPIERMNEGFE